MDALRKAEESKKKVASKAPSEAESSARQSASPAMPPAMPGKSAKPAPAPDKATSRDVPPDETGPAAPPVGTRKPASRQPIPDLAMEFDEAEADSPSSMPPTTPAPATDNAGTQASKENSATTADVGQSETSGESMDIPRQAADQDSAAQFELTPKEQTDSRQPLDTGTEPDYSAIPSAVDNPGENPDRKPGDSPAAAQPKPALALEVESPELPAVQAEHSEPDPSKSRVSPEPRGRQQSTGSSIRERNCRSPRLRRARYSLPKSHNNKSVASSCCSSAVLR